MPRLYDPKAGQVLIDGLDTRRFTLRSLRDQAGRPALIIAYRDFYSDQLLVAGRRLCFLDVALGGRPKSPFGIRPGLTFQ